MGILIKINFKIKKRFSWLVFATSWKEFEVFHCFEISYLFSLENDLEAIVFFFTPVLIFDARSSLDIWHWSFYYEIFTPVQYNVSEKCFYEKSKVVLQCSKAEKSCVEIKDAAKKSGDFDVPCSNILLRNQLSRTFLQKLKFFFKPIKSKKNGEFCSDYEKKMTNSWLRSRPKNLPVPFVEKKCLLWELLFQVLGCEQFTSIVVRGSIKSRWAISLAVVVLLFRFQIPEN